MEVCGIVVVDGRKVKTHIKTFHKNTWGTTKMSTAAAKLKEFMLQEDGRTIQDGRKWSEVVEAAQLRSPDLWE